MVAWLRNNVVARWILLLVRLWLGWQWISAGWDKVTSSAWVGAHAGVGIGGFLKHAASLSSGAHPSVQGWYAGIINGVAIPAAPFFSYVISFGELLVGIALILGFVTTFAALMGAIMNSAYLLAGTTSTNPNMLILEMILLVAGFNAAKFGLDYWVIPWFRKAMHYEVGPIESNKRLHV